MLIAYSVCDSYMSVFPKIFYVYMNNILSF